MMVRQFLAWSQTASASERAKGAGALAEAYLYSDLAPEDHREAELALTALVDDPSPSVRRALAQALAASSAAPPAVILALACDQSDISAPVLASSPLLADGDLTECAAGADSYAQAAIALRADLSASVAAALAEIGSCEAAIALAVNLSADIPRFALERMVHRFGHDAELRVALLARPGLPVTLRHDLVVATADALSAFVSACGWLKPDRAQRVAREACDRSALIIAADACEAVTELARHLRRKAHLTPSLMLRSLLCGETGLVAAALSDLSQVAPRRVAGLLAEPGGSGFAALYRKAGLPEALLPAFCAALAGLRRLPDLRGEPRLRRELARMVIEACTGREGADMARCLALVRRFELDAAREDARIEARRMAQDALDMRALPGLARAAIEKEMAALAPAAQPVGPELFSSPPVIALGAAAVSALAPPLAPDLPALMDADRIAPRVAA